LLEKFLDGGLAPSGGSFGRKGWHNSLLPLEFLTSREDPLVLLQILVDIPDVEEGILVEPNIDERRLHAGEDLEHLTLIDVTGKPLLIDVPDHQLHQLAVL
jgi:hypothetical protein